MYDTIGGAGVSSVATLVRGVSDHVKAREIPKLKANQGNNLTNSSAPWENEDLELEVHDALRAERDAAAANVDA